MLIYHRRIPNDFLSSPFSAKDRTPFFYVLTHLLDGKRYAGIKTSKGCHPSQLWTTYFSSSKVINRIIDIEGKDAFTFEVRAIFDSLEKCLKYEATFLKKIQANINPNWYNLHKKDELQPFISKTISSHNPNQCSKKSAAVKQLIWINQNNNKEKRILSSELDYYMSQGFSKGRITGISHPALKGRKLSVDHKKKLLASLNGHIVGENTKKLLSEKNKNAPKDHHCPHCNKDFVKGHFNQWHGDFCKLNPNRTKTKQWYTNGISSVRSVVCPVGFWKGLTK